jgi:hemolysin III
MSTDRVVSLREEIANAVTHGVGLLLSLIGMPILVLAALDRGERVMVIGASVFGATLIALYAASTLYHAIPHPRLKQRLRVLDHAAIYLLIAGSVPFGAASWIEPSTKAAISSRSTCGFWFAT